MKEFNYSEAFKRNIGLLTQEEQNKLKQFTIAIPGCGGVGGNHLISLVREGFEKFKIADMDVYELKNLNRQYGAELKTLNKEKVKVMKKKALEINPNCQIELFEEGINSENLDQFLENVDIAIDGLDFFEIDIRREFFNKSLKKDIPVITAGPIGFSVAGLIFDPKKKYNFDNYFDINNKTPQLDKLIHFAAGLAPSITQRKYMKNTSLKHKHGPSSIGQ